MSRRPISLWIIQIFLTIIGTLFLVGWLILIFQTIDSETREGASPVRVSLAMAILFVLGALALVPVVLAVIGLWKRKRWARWLALSILLLMFVVEFYKNPNPFKLTPHSTDGPLPYFQISPEEETGALIGQNFFNLAILAMILRLAFAKRVKAFFEEPVHGTEAPNVPNESRSVL